MNWLLFASTMKRIRRHVLRGALTAGLAYGGYKAAIDESGHFDFNNVGLVRFGRAAATVTSIGLDYRRTLRLRERLTEESEAKYGKGCEASEAAEKLLSECHLRSANRLLQLCCANGGCFIKVGQHIGALEYLLPDEYVTTMRVLHSTAPAMAMADVRAVVRDETGRELEEIFETFDEAPLGTASLAQVHKATLRDSQRVVAVKVQHRYVKRHSATDIYAMSLLVAAVKFAFPAFEFVWLADEMRKNLPLELSFVQEGLNAERISAQLESYASWLTIPTIHWPLTTDRLLTMEYCEGKQINDIAYLRSHKVDCHVVARRIGQLYADMIFKHGYVHCDPHPGNVLVSASTDPTDPRIVLLDHGLYSQLTFDFRDRYAHFWTAVINANLHDMEQAADSLGVGKLFPIFACMVTGRSWTAITKGIANHEKNTEESNEIKQNAANYLRQVASVLAKVNRQMLLLFKTNDLLRSLEFATGTSSAMHSMTAQAEACALYRLRRSSGWKKQSMLTWLVIQWRCLVVRATFVVYRQWCEVRRMMAA